MIEVMFDRFTADISAAVRERFGPSSSFKLGEAQVRSTEHQHTWQLPATLTITFSYGKESNPDVHKEEKEFMITITETNIGGRPSITLYGGFVNDESTELQTSIWEHIADASACSAEEIMNQFMQPITRELNVFFTRATEEYEYTFV